MLKANSRFMFGCFRVVLLLVKANDNGLLIIPWPNNKQHCYQRAMMRQMLPALSAGHADERGGGNREQTTRKVYNFEQMVFYDLIINKQVSSNKVFTTTH